MTRITDKEIIDKLVSLVGINLSDVFIERVQINYRENTEDYLMTLFYIDYVSTPVKYVVAKYNFSPSSAIGISRLEHNELLANPGEVRGLWDKAIELYDNLKGA